MGNCHCRDCQRATGSAFAAALLFPAGAVAISGQPRYYDSIGDSGSTVSRGFCPTCGSRLFGISGSTLGFISVMAGSLDDPSHYRPQADIYTASAQRWDAMDPDLPKFPKLPPG
jgi:hypothetical protein